MLYYKRYKRRFSMLKLLGVCIIAALITTVFYFEGQVAEYKPIFVQNQAVSVSNKAVCKAVEETLRNNSYSYDRLAKVVYSEKGTVTAIETDSVLINKLKAEITGAAQKELEKLRECEVKIPLGAFTDLTLLSNAGPEISVNFTITGNFNCKIESCFESAGINQTIHHIRLTVFTEIITTSMDNSGSVSFSTDFELAQSVIVGEVPSGYGELYRSY